MTRRQISNITLEQALIVLKTDKTFKTGNLLSMSDADIKARARTILRNERQMK